MLKNSLIYFVLWIVLESLVEVNCQMKPFKPRNRYMHTATHIDNKLYILGGVGSLGSNANKEFIYLDVSVPFNAKELSWQNLSKMNAVPAHYFATTVRGGTNNNTLFLYGGLSPNFTMELVYTFNSQNNSWNTPVIAGNNTIKKDYLTGVINNSGKMHLWSGDVQNGDYVNDMLILDTINLIWTKGSSVNAPSARMGYGATLLPNQNIIYMGGINATVDDPLPLDEVYMYDTINDSWNTKTTSGEIPSSRYGFSVILGLDNQRIIIYGGRNITAVNLATEELYELDLTNFEWTIPKISGKIPKSRFYHQANVIKNYMVISFGCCYDQSVVNDVLLLDISNNKDYKWMDFFDPNPSLLQLEPKKNINQINHALISGIIIGSLVGIAFLFGILYLYKKNKSKEQEDNIIGKPPPESIINL